MAMMSSNQTSLITGASRGMGLGYVTHYLARGWRVVATATSPTPSRPLARLSETYGPLLTYQPLDVTKEPSIAALGDRLEALGCHLQLAINNAGLSTAEPFTEWTSASFLQQLQTNAIGPALIAQAITPYMARSSTLVNVTSGMGSLELNIDPTGDLAAYALSKAALNYLTRRLAALLRPSGVTVVAINPGWVRTEMGGLDAPTSIEEAVEEIAATIQKLDMQHSGDVLQSDGSRMPF